MLRSAGRALWRLIPQGSFPRHPARSLVDNPRLFSSDAVGRTQPNKFVPNIRSGSFADIRPRWYMEDEHIRIDDLLGHLGSLLMCPTPNAFYGVFDGHGGSDAATYMERYAIKLFFEDSEFPRASQDDETFFESVENSVCKAFFNADLALADDSAIGRSLGTTALTNQNVPTTKKIIVLKDARFLMAVGVHVMPRIITPGVIILRHTDYYSFAQ